MTDSTPGTEAGLPQGSGSSSPPAPGSRHGDSLEAEQSAAGADQAGTGSRRRTIVIASVATGVVVLGGVGAALAGVFDGAEPAPVPSASTVTLASPTPTVAPAARTPLSVFADALPSTVLSYALTAVAAHPPYVATGALEGYRVDYSDGGTGAAILYAGQWETAAEATAAYTALLATAAATAAPAPAEGAEATPTPTAGTTAAAPTTGTVEVGGQPVGAWTVTTAAGGTGTATWTNGTALFQAVGPTNVVADFYEAFPL